MSTLISSIKETDMESPPTAREFLMLTRQFDTLYKKVDNDISSIKNWILGLMTGVAANAVLVIINIIRDTQ